MIEAQPYKAEHFLELYKESVEGDVGHAVEYLAHQHEWSPATSIFWDGSLVACAGIMNMWPKVGAMWSLISKNIPGNGVLAVRSAKERIENVMQDYRRIQVEVLTDSDVSVRFIEFLGFTREGTMKSYGPGGQDYYLYARVNDGTKRTEPI